MTLQCYAYADTTSKVRKRTSSVVLLVKRKRKMLLASNQIFPLTFDSAYANVYYDRRSTIDVGTTGVVKWEAGDSLISSDVIRGYNDTMILYLLLETPSYGYEISKSIKELSEEKYIIKETTLYSAFSRMEANGYVESFSDESSGKRRTYYRITETGRLYYKEKCEEWNVTKEVVNKFIQEENE